MTFSLRARVVFPVDRPPIEHGVVTIDGERIVAVGSHSAGGQMIDLGAVALLPGLVNAHTHLEFSHLRQPLGHPGMPLVDWIRQVIAERGRGDADAARSVAAGLAESLRCGVTTICDVTTRRDETHVDTPLERTLLLEVIGFSRARAASALAALQQRLAALAHRSEARIGLSPHAPYTVSPELLAKLVELARRHGMLMAMHLAESADELELLTSGTGAFQHLLQERSMWDSAAVPRRSRPLDYLRLLAAGPRALVIHGNYLDAQERAFLAANADRLSLVHCPRTHAYFAHPPFPLRELLASGVRVVLGTDSRASNPDLNLLSEMHHLVRTHPTINPHDVLQMATLAGAVALGRADQLGSITPGKLANLVSIPIASRDGAARPESLANILTSAESPSAVWLRGVQAERA